MEEFKKCDLSFSEKDNLLKSYIDDLNNFFNETNNNFAGICFTIWRIYDNCNGYWKTTYINGKYFGQCSAYDILKLFGFNRKAVERYKRCYEQFCQGMTKENICLKALYADFSPSKLFELLPLSISMIDACLDKQIIKTTMTVKEIRQKVKELAGKTDPDDLVAEDLDKIEEKTLDEQEAELPEAFDPKKTHTYEYFKAMTKEALITCLFQCEDYIKKLTTKKAGK